MPSYRTKAKTIDAIQWTGENTEEVLEMPGAKERIYEGYIPEKNRTRHKYEPALIIKSDVGRNLVVHTTDWVIRTSHGFEKLSDANFKEQYEPDQHIQINVFNTINEIRELEGLPPQGMPTWYEN